MGKKPLITIIVPVFQVKEYIRKCVESLLAQTYTNLEIILIDDGSTDGSGAVCDTYAERDSRVRVIHQGNQGLSGARNTGLDQAKGKYIAFVDSDDIVLPDYIETLYELLCKYHTDIAACAYLRCQTGEIERKSRLFNDGNAINKCKYVNKHYIGKNRKMINRLKNNAVCLSSDQMLRQWHGKYKKWETVPWNKLYCRNILEGGEGGVAIRFPIGRRHEDVLTSHLIIQNARSVVLTRQKLYLYRVRGDSITAEIITAENRKQNLMAQKERMVFFRKKRYWRAYLNLLVGYLLHLVWFEWKKQTKKDFQVGGYDKNENEE